MTILQKAQTIFVVATLLSGIALQSQANNSNNEEPKIKINNAKVEISFTEFNTMGSTITLRIHDSNEKLVYTKAFNETGTFSKAFNLSNLTTGDYIIELQTENVKHAKRVFIR